MITILTCNDYIITCNLNTYNMYLTCMYLIHYIMTDQQQSQSINFLFMYKKNIIVYYDIHKEDTQTNKTKTKVKYNDYDLQ